MQDRHEAKRTLKGRLVGPVALALALASSTAWGTLISFTATGSGSDGALSAQADFNVTDGQLIVTLTNLLGADVIRSAGQALSDISFDLSDDVGTVGALTAAGQFGNVDGSGNVTNVTTDSRTGDSTPVRWFDNGSIGGTSITLEAIGGGKPSQMITPAAPGGVLSNVNNGFQQFNSYVIGPGTFTLDLSGVTANTIISNVQFSFGTGPDTFLPGVPVPTPGLPEPGVLALLGLGLFVLAASRRWSR
jgi:hypothetical protein